MDPHQASTPLSAADQARLNSFVLEIAGEARGHPKPDGSGNWRFGRSGALVIYSDGQFHDWSADAHGHDALTLIQHCFPTADIAAWAEAFLASHPRTGNFVPHAEEQESEAVEDDTARVAYIGALHEGAGPIEGTPAEVYLTQTRALPVPPEASAWLGFIPRLRGDEGAMVAAYTDEDHSLCALGVTYITLDGQKSPHTPARQIFRGPRGWVHRALLRLGKPGPTVVETEGLEKGLAALAAGAPYVVVTGGVSRFGLVELPTQVKRVVIARDDDPQGSAPDQAMWCGVLRRLGQGIEVGVTTRPSESFGMKEPRLKDLDDVFRHDPECASILLKGASLAHGRLGSTTDNAILDKVSRLDAVALGRARKGVANLLGISVGALDDEISHRVGARVTAREAATKTGGTPGEELHPDPVTDLGGVLDEVVRIAKTHVAAPDTHFDTAALWCVHAHLVHRENLGVNITPRLAPQSPEEDSGKTTLLKIIRALVPRPKGVGSLTGSSLFRAVEARRVTLLVDEADNVFHANANPDLLAIFNSGHERTFAYVSRSIPIGDGKFEDYDFNTYTAMAFTSIGRLPIKSTQSRCISLPMRPATKEEAARLVRFRSDRCPELERCGRKFARWAADVIELPDIDVPAEFVNRIADNSRNLFQIAALAGGIWPERVVAAARADLAGYVEKQENRGAGGLLGAIWDIFAAEVTDPRRMHTQDLIMKLLELDEGRWRVANRGKPVDEWYLRNKLRDYLMKKTAGKETPPRQWRSPSSAGPKKGYHELHFEDAFERYLGKGLPSAIPPEMKPADERESSKPSSSPGTHHGSATSATDEKTSETPNIYDVADGVAVADGVSATSTPQPHGDVADAISDTPSDTQSATDKTEQNQ